MTHNILFYSRKGGQGKTTHAVSFTQYIKGFLHTNDYGNATIDIYQPVLGSENLIELAPNEEIEVDDEVSNIFDFGGFLDNRIISVAQFVDWCVVPIFYQSKADLTPAIQTIIELSKYNSNIVILINNTEKSDAQELSKLLKNKFPYEVFIIPKSRYINRLPDTGKTVFDLYENGGLDKYMLRNITPTFKKFYNFITENKA